jgi:hypothetical protein
MYCRGAVTTRYELTPQRNLLLVTRALGERFTAPQPGLPTRNSNGYEVLFGLEDDNDAVWRYRVLLGWELRAFQAPQYARHSAPIAEAALIWSPSGMTTVTATVTRSIEDAAQEAVAGYTYTSARLILDHELRRDLLVQASTGLQFADFLQSGGHAGGFSMGGGLTWLLNRNMRLAATYDFTDQRGSSNPRVLTAGSFTRSIALVTLRFGM